MKYEVTPVALRGDSQGMVSIAKTPRSHPPHPHPQGKAEQPWISKRGQQEIRTKLGFPEWLALAQIRKSDFKYISTASLTAGAHGCWNQRLYVMIETPICSYEATSDKAHKSLSKEKRQHRVCFPSRILLPRRIKVERVEREAADNTSCSAVC